MAPKHPASNGAAERFVKTFKQAMKAGRWDRSTVHHRLAQFLFDYRNTPSSMTGRTPAELLLKCQLRSRLDLLKPNFNARMENQKVEAAIRDTNKMCEFQIGSPVLVENFYGESKWLSAQAVERTGSLSYKVLVEGSIWRCHIDQIMKHNPSVVLARNNTSSVAVAETPVLHRDPEPRASVSDALPVPPASGPQYLLDTSDCRNSTHKSTRSISKVLVKIYPSRIRKPPDRLGFEGED